MRRLLLLLSWMAVVVSMQGQVRWLGTDYDFGTWREAEGRRTGRAEFVNTSSDTVIITSVRPSCGCTGADWYREPVAPGDTAWVSFTYDPTGRPGRFEKTVKVYTNPGRVLEVIHIHGTIIGKPATLERDYPVEAGPMRFVTLNHDFGRTPRTQARHAFLKGYNPGIDTIYPTVTLSRGALEAKMAKTAVAPGEMFTVGLFLNTRQLSAGAHTWPVTISIGDTSVTAQVSVDIIPQQVDMDSAAMATAPHISVPSAPVELSVNKTKGNVKFNFKVGNCGQSVLKIERVYSRAGAVKIYKFPREIKPGKEGTVEGSVDLSDVEGTAFGYIIEIISTDPLQPITTVRITGQKL